jgi:hypothetical protein
MTLRSPRRSGWPDSGSRSEGERRRQRMIRIAISAKAFEAIARTLLLCSVGYEAKPNEWGERLILLDIAARLEGIAEPGGVFLRDGVWRERGKR